MGKRPGIIQRLQVLDSDNPTFILGRTFMGQFREVTFDFEGGRVRLGNEWELVQTTVSGSNPIARALAVGDEVPEVRKGTLIMELINKLGHFENERVRELLSEFPTLFAENPKRPSRVTQDFAHCLELDRSEPIRARPRRIPPPGRKRLRDRSKKCVRTASADLLNLHGEVMWSLSERRTDKCDLPLTIDNSIP